METTRVRPLMTDKQNAVYRARYPARERSEALTHAAAGLRADTQGRSRLGQRPEQEARRDRKQAGERQGAGQGEEGRLLNGVSFLG